MRTVKCHPKPIQVQYRKRQKIFSPKGIKTEKENYTNHLIVFIRVNQHKRHLFSSNGIYLALHVNQIVMKKRHKVARVCDRLLAQHELLRLFLFLYSIWRRSFSTICYQLFYDLINFISINRHIF
jgi:hypothetical protein